MKTSTTNKKSKLTEREQKIVDYLLEEQLSYMLKATKYTKPFTEYDSGRLDEVAEILDTVYKILT